MLFRSSVADHDGVVILNDVNLRKYHSTPMRVLVQSEDGKSRTEYRLTFKGTPTGTPEVKSVTLHGKAGVADVKSTATKDGDIILHVPFANTPTFTNKDGSDLFGSGKMYESITIDATDGATVSTCHSADGVTINNNGSEVIVNEKSNNFIRAVYCKENSGHVGCVKWPTDTHCKMALYLNAEFSSANTPGDKTKTAQRVLIYFDDAKTTANITDITLTENNELVDAVGNKLPGKVNPNNKTIRLDVPYSFNRDEDNAPKAGTDLYLYDWVFNGEKVSIADNSLTETAITSVKYDFADLGEQDGSAAISPHTKHEVLIKLTEKEITSVADLSKFTPAKGANNLNVIRVWSEANATGGSDVDANGTQEYIVYAVRQNANSESKLNNVTASAPVSVTKDTSVEKLNRFIITVPKNYNSTTGINDAKEFELDFSDRSKNSTVENGQTVWAAKDVDTVKFKVADGKLYFKDNEANLTDGRVIHFTIRAEDKTSTGAYEFLKIGRASCRERV